MQKYFQNVYIIWFLMSLENIYDQILMKKITQALNENFGLVNKKAKTESWLMIEWLVLSSVLVFRAHLFNSVNWICLKKHWFCSSFFLNRSFDTLKLELRNYFRMYFLVDFYENIGCIWLSLRALMNDHLPPLS